MPHSPAIILFHYDDVADDGSKGFEVDGIQLFAVKKRGRIFLYRNRCPHAGLPLNWMPDKFLNVDNELIQCTSHGALFRIDTGQCVAGPCPGRSLRAIPFQNIDGKLCIQREDLGS